MMGNGNVGIGTTSPAQVLDVNGAVKRGTSATCSASTTGSIRKTFAMLKDIKNRDQTQG